MIKINAVKGIIFNIIECNIEGYLVWGMKMKLDFMHI